jgi:hypothetical protein
VTGLVVAASVIRKDEPAFWLDEMNRTGTAGQGMRRWQEICVIRNDRRAVWSDDLGPAGNFTSPPFSIPALLEHTVAELQDMADNLRDSDVNNTRLAELQQESEEDKALIIQAIDQAQENALMLHRKSVNGPAITVQRI